MVLDHAVNVCKDDRDITASNPNTSLCVFFQGIHYRKSCASSGACLIASSGYQQFCTGKLNSVCITCCNTPLCNGPRQKKRPQPSAAFTLGTPHVWLHAFLLLLSFALCWQAFEDWIKREKEASLSSVDKTWHGNVSNEKLKTVNSSRPVETVYSICPPGICCTVSLKVEKNVHTREDWKPHTSHISNKTAVRSRSSWVRWCGGRCHRWNSFWLFFGGWQVAQSHLSLFTHATRTEKMFFRKDWTSSSFWSRLQKQIAVTCDGRQFCCNHRRCKLCAVDWKCSEKRRSLMKKSSLFSLPDWQTGQFWQKLGSLVNPLSGAFSLVLVLLWCSCQLVKIH